MMNTRIYTILLLFVMALSTTSCREKRISYTDMIKRESSEIQSFMDKKGFTIISELPKDLNMQPNQFYEIKNEAGVGVGVWINVIKPGTLTEMAVNGVTNISCRFSFTAIGDRMKSGLTSFSNISSSASDIPPATFTYQADVNTDFQQNSFAPAPNSTQGEISMQQFVCNAMMMALKHVPVGSTIQMITSFREGPAFTFRVSSSFSNENEVGVALYYDKMTFSYKK